MDNSSGSKAGPSNHDPTKDWKNEPVVGNDGETNYPRSASVNTCDLGSILDHLKVEPPSDDDVIRNLVSFVEPSSVDKCPNIKQELQENKLVDVKEELVADEEVDLRDLNLENCQELKAWLKVENIDSFDTKEILGAASDLKFQQEVFNVKQIGESSIKHEENTNEDRFPSTKLLESLLGDETSEIKTDKNSQDQCFEERHTAESSNKNEESANWEKLPSTSLLKSLLANQTSENTNNLNMECKIDTGKRCKSKRNFSPRCALSPTDSRPSQLYNPSVSNACGKNFLTDKHLKRHSLEDKEEEPPCSENKMEQSTEINLSGEDDDASGQNDICHDDTKIPLTSKTKLEDTDSSALQTKDGLNKIKYHSGDIFCQCCDCEKDFKSTKFPSRTMQGKKQSTILIGIKPSCEICKKSFSTRAILRKHMKHTHEEEKSVCKICCQAFRGKYLKTHMKNKHSSVTNNKVFNCSKCDKTYKDPKGLKIHVRNHHNSVVKLLKPLFHCDACEKQFSSQKNLYRHKKIKHTINQEKLICAHCDAQFFYRDGLITHMVNVHLPPTIKCKMCSLLFHNSTELNRHLLVQHSIGQHEIAKVQSYVCDLCGKTLKAKYRYDYHMTTSHSTEEKKFKCQHCEKSFHYNHLLQQHSLVHSEARNFNCGLCDKAFKLKHHLRQHMAVHGLESTPDYRKRQINTFRASK